MYYIALPDNDEMFFSYVNLVINNKRKNNIEYPNTRPNKIGWVKVSYTRNEVNEPFITVSNNKEKVFVEMIINQFLLLRTYWNDIIRTFEVYPSSDKC